jgi:hypothetical protein
MQHLERRTVLNSLRDEMSSCSKKAIALECEKQEKRVSRSKQQQSRLRKKMKLAQSILAEKEEVVRKKEKKAPLYGLSPAERNQDDIKGGEERS